MSRVLYLCTAPPPAIAGTDAVHQDIDRLRRASDGRFMNLYPLKKPSRFVPQWLMGAHNRRELGEAMAKADVLHVFSAVLRPLPCIAGFRGRIVYTVTASTASRVNVTWFNDRKVLVTTGHEHDEQYLRDAGVREVVTVRPGMALDSFTYTPAPDDGSFRILVGSAPWTRGQFKTKGIDALITAMDDIPGLRLTFLWRGLWLEDLMKRIRRAGIGERVTVINEKADVNRVLASCHAAAVLAQHERLVKVWPHSAVEALAAGKPALLSRCIPMSSFVEEQTAGAAVPSLTVEDVSNAVRRLMERYGDCAGERLGRIARETFDPRRMTEAYLSLYEDRRAAGQ